MDLASIFAPASCSVNLKAKNKEAALESLAALAMRSSRLKGISEKAVTMALSERESQGSTGFGGEVAIPHARVAGMTDFVVFAAHAPKGVDFEALDKKKVHLFFVILGPEDRPSEHVQILAALSRAMSGTTMKQEIMAAGNTEILSECFLRHVGEKTERET